MTMPNCICGQINARNCPVHQDLEYDIPTNEAVMTTPKETHEEYEARLASPWGEPIYGPVAKKEPTNASSTTTPKKYREFSLHEEGLWYGVEELPPSYPYTKYHTIEYAALTAAQDEIEKLMTALSEEHHHVRAFRRNDEHLRSEIAKLKDQVELLSHRQNCELRDKIERLKSALTLSKDIMMRNSIYPKDIVEFNKLTEEK
jgi:hypothetical protein